MSTKGFFSSLLDYSFHSMITTRVVKFVYVLTTIVIAIDYVGLVGFAFAANAVLGALTLLVVGPVVALIELIWTRILLEFVIAQFRIMEGVGRLVQQAELTPAPREPRPPTPTAAG